MGSTASNGMTALQRFAESALTSAGLVNNAAVSRHAVEAVCLVPDGVRGGVLATDEAGAFRVRATSGQGLDAVAGQVVERPHLPGLGELSANRLWQGVPADMGPLLPYDWQPTWVLGAPLHEASGMFGALYAFGWAVAPEEGTQALVQLIGLQAGLALRRGQLLAEVEHRGRQLSQLLEITSHIAQSLEFAAVAQRIVDGVTAVTDFTVATLTLREGSTCRRVAASGLADPRLGLETPFASWQRLLQEEYRRGDNCYLIPPEAEAAWADVGDSPTIPGPYAWTPQHGLTITLYDLNGDLVGFLSVDTPRSGRLPTEHTIESLELFARQVQVALVNARLYEEVKRASQRDSLTGLRNRAAFWDEIPEYLKGSRPDQPVALAVVDADRFKAINDAHGHVVGDQVLAHLADRLQRSVRHTDRVYRVGGEEFTVVMPATTAAQARVIMERAQAAVRRSRADLPHLSFSAGVAEFPADARTGDALFQAADSALFNAKRAGRDRVAASDEVS